MRILSTLLFIPLLFFGALVAPGCDGCAGWSDTSSPWRFTSDTADYEVVFPGDWRLESPDDINPQADLVASLEDRYFFMVIPQSLPSFPEADLLDFQDQALDRLDSSVDDLVVERQGPIELDDVSGMAVFASGSVDGEQIHYITCYVIHGDLGYQVVAFARERHASGLFKEVDTLLSHWQFTTAVDTDDDKPVPDPDEVPKKPGPLEEASDNANPSPSR